MIDETRRKWAYDPERCDGVCCNGNCSWCMYNPDHDGGCDDAEVSE